jgi:CheY-like chemotaxis protein
MTHILVVEDDEFIQMVVRKALTKIGGFTVTVTEDAESALALVRSGQVDLVVMDVSLDNSHYQGESIDGLGLTRLLKADPLTRLVPVLLATAHARLGDGERLSRACGADGYMTKPFEEPRALVARVQRLLASMPTRPYTELSPTQADSRLNRSG